MSSDPTIASTEQEAERPSDSTFCNALVGDAGRWVCRFPKGHDGPHHAHMNARVVPEAFDYPAAARSIALHLAEWCDESLPYPQMIAEAARRAKRTLDTFRNRDADLSLGVRPEPETAVPACNDCGREIEVGGSFTHCRFCVYTRDIEHHLQEARDTIAQLRAAPVSASSESGVSAALEAERRRGHFPNCPKFDYPEGPLPPVGASCSCGHEAMLAALASGSSSESGEPSEAVVWPKPVAWRMVDGTGYCHRVDDDLLGITQDCDNLNRALAAHCPRFYLEPLFLAAARSSQSSRVEALDEETGVSLIAAERARQIESHGFDAKRDDEYVREELARVAIHYAMPTRLRHEYRGFWPHGWDQRWNQRDKDDRITQLVKAGALIAAEIDRLRRAARSGGRS